METLRLPATMESLERLCAFVVQRARQCGIAAERLLRIELVLEELLTNVIHYAYPDAEGDIEVQCFMEDPACFCLIIRDWGRAFDPLAKETPCVSTDVCERPVGGLGIYLVRHKADDVCYQRQDDRNVLKVCFNLDR